MIFRRIHPEWVLTLFLLLVAALVLPHVKADAATANCGAAEHLFAGRYYDPTGGTIKVRGASAVIETEQANLCTSGPFTDSSAWSMVADDGGFGYAQIGWLHQSSGSQLWRHFWEWVDDYRFTDTHQRRWNSPSPGQQHEYRVSRYMTDGRLHMILNGSEAGCNTEQPPVCAETDFDPTVSWVGLHAEWFGEVQHPGDDVAGIVGTEADFLAISFRDQNGNWLSNGFTGNPIVHRCYYHVNTASNQNFEIWTSPLNHSC